MDWVDLRTVMQPDAPTNPMFKAGYRLSIRKPGACEFKVELQAL